MSCAPPLFLLENQVIFAFAAFLLRLLLTVSASPPQLEVLHSAKSATWGFWGFFLMNHPRRLGEAIPPLLTCEVGPGNFFERGRICSPPHVD